MTIEDLVCSGLSPEEQVAAAVRLAGLEGSELRPLQRVAGQTMRRYELSIPRAAWPGARIDCPLVIPDGTGVPGLVDDIRRQIEAQIDGWIEREGLLGLAEADRVRRMLQDGRR